MIMSYAFDLISDLFLTNANQVKFNYKQSSPIAIVAGNVASDKEVLLEVLTNLSECYTHVFFIDGFFEHYGKWDRILETVEEIGEICEMFSNVTYLQDKVIISEGVAIVGTNGWWDYKFDPKVDQDQAVKWHRDKYKLNDSDIESILSIAVQDAVYLYNSVGRLQKHGDVRNIVIVTNATPEYSLVKHNSSLNETYRASVLGNSLLSRVRIADTEQKLTTWCHGAYSSGVAESMGYTTYYNNPMKRLGQEDNLIYCPRRIVV